MRRQNEVSTQLFEATRLLDDLPKWQMLSVFAAQRPERQAVMWLRSCDWCCSTKLWSVKYLHCFFGSSYPKCSCFLDCLFCATVSHWDNLSVCTCEAPLNFLLSRSLSFSQLMCFLWADWLQRQLNFCHFLCSLWNFSRLQLKWDQSHNTTKSFGSSVHVPLTANVPWAN